MRLSAVRQALGFLVLFSVISVVAWGGTYLLVWQEMLRTVDARLTARMEATIANLDAGDGLLAVGAGETTGFVGDAPPEGFRTLNAEIANIEMRYLIRTTAHGRVELGENTERQEELRDILAAGMQISLAATIVLTALFALWIARRSQERLNVINAGLTRVAQGDLAARIALRGQDDLSMLADRIDTTTARLDTVMTQIRVQSSNIAHDLRTPLARLRAQIERCLLDLIERDQPVTQSDLETALAQIDRLTATFEALLRLARIESGAGRDAFEPVNMRALIDEVVETYGPVVEDAGQVLTVAIEDAGAVHGDHNMLVQLLANLLQNALRHGAAMQTIAIRMYGHQLSVTDQGPGIPVEHREAVLQPLYQGEATRQGDGFGLGLALVRAIAELHNAEVALSEGPGDRGLCVTLTFPKLTEL